MRMGNYEIGVVIGQVYFHCYIIHSVWGFVNNTDDSPPNCAYTKITDRIIVTAAHCTVIGR